MKRAVFLDRDGTINIDKQYLYKIEDFEYLPGAIDALKLFQKAGYLLIIITNQSGIARGLYTESDYNILTTWMLSDLEAKGVHIDKIYMCPHLPDGVIATHKIECTCRKPRTGLFLKAVEEFAIDLSQSIAIGDNERDLSICENGKCKGFLIEPNKCEGHIKDGIVRVDSLYDAAVLLLSLCK